MDRIEVVLRIDGDETGKGSGHLPVIVLSH